MEGPLVGKFYPDTSDAREDKWTQAPEVMITQIKTCNSVIKEADVWCYMEVTFDNGETYETEGAMCKTEESRKC